MTERLRLGVNIDHVATIRNARGGDHPDPVRMLLTGHADIDAVIDAINKGRIYKYISKPWNEAELKRLVEEAAELARARSRSSKLNEAYSRNLLALRNALAEVRDACHAESALPQETRAMGSWGAGKL